LALQETIYGLTNVDQKVKSFLAKIFSFEKSSSKKK
jgi:hypothetical protein